MTGLKNSPLCQYDTNGHLCPQMTESYQSLHHQFFRDSILTWSKDNPRDFPWVGEKDPYLIWVSEIILQQTRVDQGKPYYLKFKKHYPTAHKLAAAKEDDLMKLWQGLGYYSRARNLHTSAKRIVEEYEGIFPKEYKQILSLKGIGPYTAAAISSFAFGFPLAVVDGNVLRVLSRFFGLDVAIDSLEGKRLYFNLANKLISQDYPAEYNQAIMDFGAVQCIPGKPNCDQCPLQSKCQAFEMNMVSMLPIKLKRIKKKNRYFHFLVMRYQDKIMLKKRFEKDIWQNLYAFPLIEKRIIDMADLTLTEEIPFKKAIGEFGEASKLYQQLLTHQKIHATFKHIF